MSKILIIGGSLGGLLAANVLHREGHDVCVLEKARGSMDGRGAGIVTHDALFAGLRRAGLDGTEALGVQVQQRVALDVEGKETALLEMPQILTSWSRLYEALHQLLPAERYVQGVVVEKVDSDATGAAVHGATPQALLAYEKSRLPEGQTAVARARWLGAYMQSQTSVLSAQQAGRSALGVVSETAIDLGRYGHLSSFPGVAAYRPDFAAVRSTIL
jgi:choline dehydrogenase-like flavoprotein